MSAQHTPGVLVCWQKDGSLKVVHLPSYEQALHTLGQRDPHSRESNLQATLDAAREENGRLVQALSYTTKEHAAMHEQRDELLAAVRHIAVCDDLKHAIGVANAAIAKATGGQS